MRERDLQLLEYEKFLDELATLTPNEKTQEKIKNLKPLKDEKVVKDKVSLQDSFLKIYEKERFFPLGEYPDISKSLEILKIRDSVLSPFEIRNIANLINISRQIKKFLQVKIEKEDSQLLNLYKNLYSSRETERIIYDSIDEAGFVKDSASRELAKIRSQIKETERKIISILESIIYSQKYDDIIQERIITTRRNRYVIPVKENYSSKIKGIIHDRSSTGHTIFLEPLNIVELNNKLSDLKIQEQIEVRKVLQFLTDILRTRIGGIRNAFNAVVEFDYLYTVAKYALKANARFPEIGQDFYLKEAIHPLFALLEKQFVPIDIIVDRKKRGLVITGPNTGGKTVALKTAGLFSLLVQTGIPVPVREDSRIPIVDGVFVDIGDYQSIEANLSTYSWHISNIKDILSKVSDKSLVLLDELIPGTDPDEGSAIGIGILKFLKGKNSFVIATSHFKPIKLFALSDDYFEVAAVGFDKEKLTPTYQIHYKTIGQSMAFYIARRLGFYEEILKEAEKYLSKESIQLEKAIEELEKYKVFYDIESRKVEQLRKQLEEEKRKYEKLNAELEELKKKKWKESIKEIEQFVDSIKKEGYSIIQNIKENPSGRELERFIKKVKTEISSATVEKVEPERINLEIGDKVKIKGKNTVGEVVSVREDRANVNFNGIKIWVPIKDLERIDASKREEKKTKFHVRRERVKIKPEINLIGLTRDEAIKKLSDFLDNAVLEGYTHLRIIHGYGSGTLRKAVREYLDSAPYNLEYKDAEYHEGGMGVTVVDIK